MITFKGWARRIYYNAKGYRSLKERRICEVEVELQHVPRPGRRPLLGIVLRGGPAEVAVAFDLAEAEWFLKQWRRAVEWAKDLPENGVEGLCEERAA